MKKAQFAFNNTLIGLIIAAIIIIPLFMAVENIYSAVLIKPDQDTTNNFDRLINEITTLTTPAQTSQETETKQQTEEKDFMIQKGMGWVGFDSDVTKYKSSVIFNLGSAEHDLKRPTACLGKTCICLIKNLNNKDDSYQECKTLQNIRYISAEVKDNKNNLNLGESNGHGVYMVIFNNDDDFGIRTVDITVNPLSNDATKFDLFLNILEKTQTTEEISGGTSGSAISTAS